MRSAPYVVSLATLLASFWLVLRYAPVRAEGPRALTEIEALVARNHSVISANEAGFEHPADEYAIWQTLENIAGGHHVGAAEIASAMDRHSGRATGADAPRTHRYGNHRWTRDLAPDCHEPARWAEIYPHLPWHFYERPCQQLFARSRRLVRERPRVRVCRGRPITWGGRYGLDDDVLRRRNEARVRRGRRPLVRLECSYRGRPPINGFYGVAPAAEGS